MEPQKEFNKTIYLVVAVLILATLFSLSLFTGNEEIKEASNQNNDTIATNNDQAEVEGTTETDTVETNTTETKPVTQNKPAGVYVEYDAQTMSDSKAENIILFFHATWCPSCRALNTDIEENLANIPPNTEIYKVDYDTYTDLKKKYDITTQHTLVLIKNDGTMIKKWSGSPTLDRVISSI